MADDPNFPGKWKCANPLYQAEMMKLFSSLQAMKETERRVREHLKASGIDAEMTEWELRRTESPALAALSRLLSVTVKSDPQPFKESEGHLPGERSP
jgi:hypothetical protein